jgi:hypothetical protein
VRRGGTESGGQAERWRRVEDRLNRRGRGKLAADVLGGLCSVAVFLRFLGTGIQSRFREWGCRRGDGAAVGDGW